MIDLLSLPQAESFRERWNIRLMPEEESPTQAQDMNELTTQP